MAQDWTDKNSDDATAWSKLAHVCDLQGDSVAALGAVDRAIELSTSQPQPALWFKKALYLFAVGDYTLCVDAFEKCREYSSNGYYAQAASLGLAKTLGLLNEYELASQNLAMVDADASMWLGGLVEASALRHQFERRQVYTQSMRMGT